VAALLADDLGDLLLHQLGQHAQADAHRQGQGPSWAAPTGSPSPSCTAGRQRRSSLATACRADGGFWPSGVAEHLPKVHRAFIAGRRSAGSRRTNRRLARYRVGCEGRISHLKRRYGLRRSRLRGHTGARTWVAWAILSYNLDTLAIRGA
jgi:IS5 family transposase